MQFEGGLAADKRPVSRCRPFLSTRHFGRGKKSNRKSSAAGGPVSIQAPISGTQSRAPGVPCAGARSVLPRTCAAYSSQSAWGRAPGLPPWRVRPLHAGTGGWAPPPSERRLPFDPPGGAPAKLLPSCCSVRWRPRWILGTASSLSSSMGRTGRRQRLASISRRKGDPRKTWRNCTNGCGTVRRRCGGSGRRIS